MADAVNTQALWAQTNGRRYAVRLTNRSDGTGESGVTKVDISTLKTPKGETATWSVIDRIVGHVSGFNHVRLVWDHNTDDEIAVLSGSFDLDFDVEGGLRDPRSAGGTGDILLTTNGAVNGASYDITIYLRLRA
ncbi:MAG: hypothetical protein KF895_02965 [Parvibaculum sp.]|nr:hypothetical protein [Parvibaculum sp.]